jgi:acetylornithine/succinyldiaminopimelate/putrescine aminotransferase
MMEKLEARIGDKVIGVRGWGLEIGIQFKDDETCEQVQKGAFADGLHVIVGGENNMQIMPPLTTPQDVLDEGLDVLITRLDK